MSWWTALQNVLGSASGTALALWFAKYLGDRSLQKEAQRHSNEQAEIQNTFSMGATSHMATVVFDKYVGFCEEYVAAMSNTLPTLIGGRTTQTPSEFVGIRQKWALWLTDEVESKLDGFERRIPRIPSEAPILDAYGGHVSSIEDSVKSVISDLRKVLATEELTTLRAELVARSSRQPANLRR